MKKKFDIAELKKVPILRVADKLGIHVVTTGGDCYQQKNPDGPGVTSLTLFIKTNSFVRFSGKEQGGCSRGSVIDFVMHVTDNANFKDACALLSKI